MAAFPNPFRALSFIGRGSGSHGGPALARTGSRYMGDEKSPFMFNWRPALREAQADTAEAWQSAAARVIDTLHTQGFLKGGIASVRGQMIFPDGLRQNLKPFGSCISSDPKITAAWARDVEGRFKLWFDDPLNVDWGSRYTGGQLLGQGIDQFFATGEIVATLPYREVPGATHGLKINVIPSTRLSQQNGPPPNTVQGVTLDPISGAPIGYNFHQYNYATGVLDQRYVKARDERGRPVVIHLLDNAPTAVRGITPLAPALRVVKQFDQLQDATLTGALIQTIFAATIESAAPTEDMLRALQDAEEQDATDDEAVFLERRSKAVAAVEGVPPGAMFNLLEKRAGWYKNTNIDLGRFGKIAHLFPNEKLVFNKAQYEANNYKEMTKVLHREISKCIGCTTYQLDNDFDGFTYTTAKMAVDEAWPMNLWRRAHFPGRMMQTIFEAWLEEDIMRGYTILPGGLAQFYAQRHLICRSDWRGPPRPTADELKTAKANQVLRAEGWQSTEGIAAEYGNDWVEVADSQEASDDYRVEKGLPPLPSLGGGGNGAGSSALANPEGDQSGAANDREARLVGALVRNDDTEVEKILMEYPNVQRRAA